MSAAERVTTTLVPPLAREQPSTGREGFVDATRGAAMFFVCLSHFGDMYLSRVGQLRLQRWLHTISFIASPTFIVVSGFTLGWLYRTRSPQSFASFSRKLVDRGLFLLSIGHGLIWLAHEPLMRRGGDVEFWGFITDAIAVCLILGGFIVPRTSAVARTGMALLLYAASCALFEVWAPKGPVAGTLEAFLIGCHATPQHPRAVTFPIVPWFALYLMATAIGERVPPARAGGWRYLLRGGGIASLVGLGFHLVSHRLVSSGAFDIEHPAARLLNGGHKFPPGPAYFLLFGGLGTMLLGTMAWLEENQRLVRTLQVLAHAGQASLVLFIAQYFVYMAGLSLFEFDWTPWWPLYFAVSVVGLYFFGNAFQRRFGSRLFTVGLQAWSRRKGYPRTPTGPRLSTDDG